MVCTVSSAELFALSVLCLSSPFPNLLSDDRSRTTFPVLSARVQTSALFALTLLLGITNSFAQPSRMALISSLVDRAALPSALAINSIVFNLARFVGPMLAGLAIVWSGVAAAFAANAVSYLAFLAAHTGVHVHHERDVVAGALAGFQIGHFRLLAGRACIVSRHGVYALGRSGRVESGADDHRENKLVPAIHISQGVKILDADGDFFSRLDVIG